MRNENEQPLIPKRRNVVNWYVLYTSPRTEKRVQARLEEQGMENYLPLHRVPRVWSDRIKMVDTPLFSSYIFVRCREGLLRPLLLISGVARIVYYNGTPAIIRQKDIDAIRIFLRKASERPLCVGEEAEILCGSMKHVSGRVQKVKKKYLLLYIEQLGAIVSVSIANVARADRLK
ncbi:MAG: UpxY family transcription antiterminator [Tannerella sp.]|jgi:transcription antitermination factor NusG|nr:UpxY family transcription antiterminator [Tannerella sp.]